MTTGTRHRTPLRYPGGKQKLAPFIREVMESANLTGGDYVEPFAGGAGVAVELLLSGTAGRIHLNDLSTPVYAFWRVILFKTDEFCRRVSRAALTVDEWRKQKAIFSRYHDHCQADVAFSFFFLNRCNRSGIPNGGIIGGLDQSGPWKIDARFPRNELIRRIEAIAAHRTKITLKNQDAETYLSEYVPKLPRKTLIYLDPPYFRKADRLYINHYEPADHKRIAGVIQSKVKRPWVVSYDGAPEIIKLYAKRRCFIYDLQYNAAQAYKGKEVFVFSDKLVLPNTSSLPCIKSAFELMPEAKRERFVAAR